MKVLCLVLVILFPVANAFAQKSDNSVHQVVHTNTQKVAITKQLSILVLVSSDKNSRVFITLKKKQDFTQKNLILLPHHSFLFEDENGDSSPDKMTVYTFGESWSNRSEPYLHGDKNKKIFKLGKKYLTRMQTRQKNFKLTRQEALEIIKEFYFKISIEKIERP